MRAGAAGNTGGKRTIAMAGEQFIGRLLQHVLPPGFKRIRHYGLLAPATKTERLATARKLLAMPAANRQAREDAQAFMRRVAAFDMYVFTGYARCHLSASSDGRNGDLK